MKARTVRRVVSHHGSDCSLLPHPLRASRCVIVTRIDFPGAKQSLVVVRGDWCESRANRRRLIPASAPATYGGGFWERVEIPALVQA